jgi:exoribonuclease-2
MGHDVIAFPRRDRVVIGAVLAEDVGPDGRARVTVLAEDGARFALPAEQAIVRFQGLLDGLQGTGEVQRLAKLRAGASGTMSWPKTLAAAVPGASLSFDELAALAGATDVSARLRVALALGSAEPWLRRNGPVWAVVPREEASAKLAAADAARRAEKEDAAILEWWPRRGSSPAPPAASGAVAALAAFGMAGDLPATSRGRLLAARLDLGDPDQAVEALVACGALPQDTDPSAHRAGLAEPFPAAADEEARRAAAEPVTTAGREDLTGLFAVSVDDEETIEVDDALSVRPAEGGVEILVHISDAAAVVARGGALDEALRARCSSLYRPDGPVTMLPLALVLGRASLDLGRVREAVTGFFVVAPDGTVRSSRFARTLVRVARRLTYEQTSDPAVLAADPASAAALVAAAAALREARIRGGATVTNLPSLKVRAEGGVPSVERRVQDTPGDTVVAESAVLFNAEAGKLFAARDAAALFRVQDPPRLPDPRADDPLRPLLVRRRFAPTHLRVEPSRHHGVGCDAYAQCTSPMRRYADLVNQRQLLAVAAGEKAPYLPAELETLAEHVSQRERAVRTATWVARDVERRGVREMAGVLSRMPRRGFGGVWVEDLLQELPLRVHDRWRSPPEGTSGTWRVARVAPWRGRIELSPIET